MKIKFINPIKLMRILDCFFYDDCLLYDINKITKTPEEYELDLKDSKIIDFYTDRDLKDINFDEYYELKEKFNDLEFLKSIEENNCYFFIKLDEEKFTFFTGAKERYYYELYDDNLNLIK